MNNDLSEQFAWFASSLSAHHSPLYSRLSEGIANDPELLALAAEAESGPVSNLFLAAVHSLLLAGKRKPHSLADFYPSVSEAPSPQ